MVFMDRCPSAIDFLQTDRQAEVEVDAETGADVGEDDIGRRAAEPRGGRIAVAHGDDRDVLIGEGQLDDALNRHAVVGQQQFVHHSTFAAPSPRRSDGT